MLQKELGRLFAFSHSVLICLVCLSVGALVPKFFGGMLHFIPKVLPEKPVTFLIEWKDRLVQTQVSWWDNRMCFSIHNMLKIVDPRRKQVECLTSFATMRHIILPEFLITFSMKRAFCSNIHTFFFISCSHCKSLWLKEVSYPVLGILSISQEKRLTAHFLTDLSDRRTDLLALWGWPSLLYASHRIVMRSSGSSCRSLPIWTGIL